MKKPLVVVSLALAIALCLPVVYAQVAATNVSEVRVTGNKDVSAARILNIVRVKVGDTYDDEVVRNDEQRLLKSGLFDKVTATRTRTQTGVIVTFQVAERPKVAKLEIRGNKNLKERELVSEIPFVQGDPLNRYNVEAGREALLNKYRSKGYYFAQVATSQPALQANQVVYTIVEGPKVAVRSIRFQGNHYSSSLWLRLKIGSNSRFWPFTSGTLDSEQIEKDVNTLRAYLQGEGFLDVEVDRRLDFSDDKSRVVLTFLINEGPRYTVNEVRFDGNAVYSSEELSKRLILARGEFYTALSLRRDIKKLQDTYGEVGYIEADVTSRHVRKEQPGQLDVIFTVRERDQFKVGEVIVRGNDVTQSRVIRRELRFYPEQLYNTVAVEESRQRLRELRIFDSVEISPVGRQPGVRDALVQVREGKTAEFLVGFGVSSNNGLLGNISFTQRNFNLLKWPESFKQFYTGQAMKGAGQTLSVIAEPGTELMRFSLEWVNPYLFDQPYSLGNRIFLFARGRETWDETRYGDVISVGHRFKNRWYGELATRLEGVKVDNLDDNDAPPEVVRDEGSHLVLGLKGSLVRDRTDSRWIPTRGDRFSFSYEQVTGDYNFPRVTGDYRIYHTVWVDALDRKHVLASRVSAAHNLSEAPIFERFYGGGIGSLRGFEYRGISPRSKGFPNGIGFDEPIGGDFMFFLGTEYRFPIVGTEDAGQLQGVVFLDSGTVEENVGFSSYRVSTGVGVRWFIPMFGPVPISIDFGFPLLKESGDDTEVLSFSFGWRF